MHEKIGTFQKVPSKLRCRAEKILNNYKMWHTGVVICDFSISSYICSITLCLRTFQAPNLCKLTRQIKQRWFYCWNKMEKTPQVTSENTKYLEKTEPPLPWHMISLPHPHHPNTYCTFIVLSSCTNMNYLVPSSNKSELQDAYYVHWICR